MRPLLVISLVVSMFTVSLFAQKQDTNSFSFEYRNNSVYLAHDFFFTISINYERIFVLNEKNNLGLRLGLGNNSGERSSTVIGEVLYVYGKNKHFFELGLGINQPYAYRDQGPDNPDIALMAGWRYQAKSGFMLKVYPEFLPDFYQGEDSWGSLPFIGFALGKTF